MKIKVNKAEYPVIILEEYNIKSNHTDLDIQQLKIEFTVYEKTDKQALSDILSEKLITIINGNGSTKKYSILHSSYSNSSTDSHKSQKYKLELREIENLSLDVLNIDSIEFQPYFYEESFKDGLQIFSKIKTDKKGFDFINEKKFSSELEHYHGLIQAFSRTNRIYDATKTFGNVVTFRDLEKATIDAITLFGDSNTKNVVLEKSYKEYLEDFTDIATGEARRGYVEVVKELNEKFPDPDAIATEKDKKEFAKLFGEYLRVEKKLQNYDEFNNLKALQGIDINNLEAVEEFKKAHFVTDEDIAAMQKIELLKERTVHDYRSTYNDIRDWLRREKSGAASEDSNIDWDDVVFEIDLLKTQEINLDYILELIFEHNKKKKDKATLIEEIRRVIRASVGNRAKESLVVDFINETDLDTLQDKANVIDSFFVYAQSKQKAEAIELIAEENLNEEAAKRYITTSLKREYASENGTELNALLPKMSPLNPQYLTKKQRVFQKLVSFVEKFKGVGGQL